MSRLSLKPDADSGTVMVVDDTPANLTLLEDMLSQHGYQVRSFPRGRLALASALERAPELVLLDINMPEMDGFEVCRQFKSSPSLRSVPVIFLSALDAVEDKVQGFQVGAIDYISKPFQFEEVQARVETHLKLYRAQQSERELLEQTLSGAIGALWELVQLTSPMLAARSKSIRDIVSWISKTLSIFDWQYEPAATLCLMGCVSLPDDVFQRGYGREALAGEEARMFQAHPNGTADLIARIPRMRGVAELIRVQLEDHLSQDFPDDLKRGAIILQLAIEFDRKLYKGVTAGAALNGLSTRFEARMLASLQHYSPSKMELVNCRLPLRNLRPDMILESDLLSSDGNIMILQRGTVLTERWIERLSNFAKTRGIPPSFEVRVPHKDVLGKVHQPVDRVSR